MPNWCENRIIISHPNKKLMAKAIKAWKAGKFLEVMVPEPDYNKAVVYPHPLSMKPKKPVKADEAWYDWRRKNWGCKWDLTIIKEATTILDNKLFGTFDSPWCPPIEAYDTLTKQGFHIEAFYFEGSNSFCGKYTSEDGDKCCTIPATITKVKKLIPADIEREFHIIEQMVG